MNPKARKTFFVVYDRYTDKVFRVFNPEKKIMERIADIKIDDVTDTIDQVFFPLPSEKQEEESEELIVEESQVEDSSISADSDNNFTNIILQQKM